MTRCGAGAARESTGDFMIRLVVPSYIFGSMSSTALRSPSIEISICSSVDGAAEQEAAGVAVQVDAEHVLAVGREGVHHRHAAARAERRAVDALQLRGGLGHAVVRLAGLGVADRRAPARRPGRRRAGSSPSAPARRSARRRRCRSPWLMVSAGSSAVTSMSSASRSLTARAYSARFSRRKLREPGCGARSASASMRVSKAAAMSASRCPPGAWRRPAASCLARSLRIIFSASSRRRRAA